MATVSESSGNVRIGRIQKHNGRCGKGKMYNARGYRDNLDNGSGYVREIPVWKGHAALCTMCELFAVDEQDDIVDDFKSDV